MSSKLKKSKYSEAELKDEIIKDLTSKGSKKGGSKVPQTRNTLHSQLSNFIVKSV